MRSWPCARFRFAATYMQERHGRRPHEPATPSPHAGSRGAGAAAARRHAAAGSCRRRATPRAGAGPRRARRAQARRRCQRFPARNTASAPAEGVALLCLAEALLRIPDAATADALIEDRIGGADWQTHLGHGDSLAVNASAWAFMLTGRVLTLDDAAGRHRRGDRPHDPPHGRAGDPHRAAPRHARAGAAVRHGPHASTKRWPVPAPPRAGAGATASTCWARRRRRRPMRERYRRAYADAIGAHRPGRGGTRAGRWARHLGQAVGAASAL